MTPSEPPGLGRRRDPVVIGALGGSGTRVFARLCRKAGVYMGSLVNNAEDSTPMMEYYATWLRRYLQCGGKLHGAAGRAAETEFRQRLDEHLVGHTRQDHPWGVKVPRNILMLRFWSDRFPACRFIHVVRHGVDMAYSRDKNQLNMVGDLILSGEERHLPAHLQAITYWQRVNLAAAEFGALHLGQQYLLLRYDDLCESPAQVCKELFDFLGVSYDEAAVRAAAGLVESPPTIGRWQEHPPAEIRDIMATGRAALERFGYWDEAMWRSKAMRA